MINFFKIIGLSLAIFIILFLLIKLIPSSSIEVSSKTEYPAPAEEASIFKSISSLFSSKDKSTEKNILLLGRPGQGYSGGNLTDTIIIAHLEPNGESAILISLPRDLLVKIPDQDRLTKINSLYSLSGIEGLKDKVEEITNLSIDYYALVDLVVVKEIIELIDGLNVYVPQDINDPYFPGPNYTYQTFNLKAGWRYLDGESVLKYVRTRYTSPNGDFDRMARQQQIIRLVKQKVLTFNLLWDLPTYLKIFNTLKNHIQTDLSLMEIRTLWQMVKELNPEQINHLVIDKKRTNLLIGGQVTFGQQPASVVYPKAGQDNYIEIQNYILSLINL